MNGAMTCGPEPGGEVVAALGDDAHRYHCDGHHPSFRGHWGKPPSESPRREPSLVSDYRTDSHGRPPLVAIRNRPSFTER